MTGALRSEPPQQRKVAVIPTLLLTVGDDECSVGTEQRLEERGRGSKAGAQERLDGRRKIHEAAAGRLA
jgi:hypothetical protein